MDYSNLFTKNLPAEVASPPGQADDAKYTFSVTYTDKDTMPVQGFAEALADSVESAREGEGEGDRVLASALGGYGSERPEGEAFGLRLA